MSDLSMTCPTCDAHTSDVGRAYRDGNPCPHCGIPYAVTEQVLAARQRYLDDERTHELEQAIVARGQAEQQRDVTRAALIAIEARLAELHRLVRGALNYDRIEEHRA